MGFLSRSSHSSSGRKHYSHGKHGSDYYKRSGKRRSGILGKIIDTISGSRSHSYSHRRRRHSRKSFWS